MFNRIENYLEEHNIIVRGIALVLGCFICGLIYNAFMVPNDLVCGGFGGIAIIVNNYTGMSPVLFLNISVGLTLILSIIVLGFKHTIHSIIGYVIYIAMITLTMPLAKYFTFHMDSFLFECLVYSIVLGVGSGLIYRSGFDTGGIDTILVICRDKFKIPFATVDSILNGIIIICGVLTFGYIKAIYAIITLIIVNKVDNSVLIGLSSKKMVFIKTKNIKELTNYIEKDLDTGYTLIQSSDGFSIFKRTIVMCVVPTYRYYTLKNKVKSLDSKAILFSHNCYNVTGGRTNQLVPI